MAGTRLAKPLTIGAAVTVLASLAASVLLYVNGQIQVTREVNFIQDGNNTGATLQVSGVARFQAMTPKAISATGGLTTYSTWTYRSPYSTTGALLGLTAECGNMANALVGDVSFKKTSTSASGSVLTGLDNVSLGTGALAGGLFTSAVKWNPADLLTFTTLVAPTGTLNTTRYDCKLAPIVLDKYGS